SKTSSSSSDILTNTCYVLRKVLADMNFSNVQIPIKIKYTLFTLPRVDNTNSTKTRTIITSLL
ncbi:MAG: hypothetical protein ACJ71F_18230, partial [Nitrososphaeraceae archaeon]